MKRPRRPSSVRPMVSSSPTTASPPRPASRARRNYSMANISPVCESRKALVAFPQKPASLHRQLAAAMGRRQVAVVCPPGRDDPDPGETFYIVRGDLIAELGYVDGDGGDFPRPVFCRRRHCPPARWWPRPRRFEISEPGANGAAPSGRVKAAARKQTTFAQPERQDALAGRTL